MGKGRDGKGEGREGERRGGEDEGKRMEGGKERGSSHAFCFFEPWQLCFPSLGSYVHEMDDD